MALFGRKDDDDDEEYDDEDELIDEDEPRKIRDLKPKNKKKRKEPVKPWGKRERLIVLIVLGITVVVSTLLALSARGFKFPGFPKIDFNFFSGETITLEKDNVK